MDLSNLIPTSETITVTVKHPVTDDPLLKDDGTEMTIEVYAPHSAEYKAVVHEQTNKRLQKVLKNKKTALTSEDVEAMTTDLIVKTTKSWNIQINKKTPKFSVAEASELYTKLPWLKQQIIDAQEDYSSFLKS